MSEQSQTQKSKYVKVYLKRHTHTYIHRSTTYSRQDMEINEMSIDREWIKKV